jgi:branched-chain amino acid transport system substrate-binding protein
VLYAFIPAGKDAMAFVEAYDTLNLNAAGIRLVGPGGSFPEDELRTMKAMPEGMITVAHYSAWAERPQNKAFVAAWKKEYGPDAVPADASVAAWDAMTALYSMVKAQNGKLDPERTMEQIKAFKNDDSPRGPVMIDPETRDIVQNQYLRRYEKVDGFYRSREFETIPMVKDPWVRFNPAP